jgi:hypothetical protein
MTHLRNREVFTLTKLGSVFTNFLDKVQTSQFWEMKGDTNNSVTTGKLATPVQDVSPELRGRRVLV